MTHKNTSENWRMAVIQRWTIRGVERPLEHRF